MKFNNNKISSLKLSSLDLENGLESAGANNKYQMLILFIFFFVKIVTDSFYCPLPYFLMNPNVKCFERNEKFDCGMNKVCFINNLIDNNNAKGNGDKKDIKLQKINFLLNEKKPKNTFINYYDIYCDTIKIGLIASSASIGNLLSNLISPFFTDIFGRINTIKYTLLFDIVLKLSLFYIKEFNYLLLNLSLINITNNLIYFSACLYINEMVSSSHRGIYSCLFNGFFGISGICFTIVFFSTYDWWYVNSFSLSCSIISYILIYFLLYESLRFFNLHANNLQIFEVLEKISIINSKQKDYEKWVDEIMEKNPFEENDSKNYLVSAYILPQNLDNKFQECKNHNENDHYGTFDIPLVKCYDKIFDNKKDKNINKNNVKIYDNYFSLPNTPQKKNKENKEIILSTDKFYIENNLNTKANTEYKHNNNNNNQKLKNFENFSLIKKLKIEENSKSYLFDKEKKEKEVMIFSKIFGNYETIKSFVIFSFISFVTISGIMYNAVEMKESPDSIIYPLSLYFSEFVIISIIGYVIDSPNFGRKSPCVFFSLLAGFCYISKFFLDLSNQNSLDFNKSSDNYKEYNSDLFLFTPMHYENFYNLNKNLNLQSDKYFNDDEKFKKVLNNLSQISYLNETNFFSSDTLITTNPQSSWIYYLNLILDYLARFSVSISFNILIEYNFEIYSTDIRSIAFNVNKLFSRFGDFFTPLLMSKYHSLTTFFLGVLYVVMAFSIRFLRETSGERLMDDVNENDEKLK